MHSFRIRFAFAAALAQLVLPIALAVTMLVSASAQNLVVNGSFEEPDVGWRDAITYYAGSTSIPGWRVTQGAIDLYRRWSPAYHGRQCIDLNGFHIGGIEQQIYIATPGLYLLEFAMSGNPRVPDVVYSMRVAFGSFYSETFLFDLKTHPGHTGWNMQWDGHSRIVRVPAAGTYTLSFVSTSAAYPNDPCDGPALDAVSLTLVPEPTPFIVLGTSLVSLIAFRWRRR